MAALSSTLRNAGLLVAVLAFGGSALMQGCSGGTLTSPEDYNAEASKFASGGGTGVGPAAGGSTSTGGGGPVKPDSDFYPEGCDVKRILVSSASGCTTSSCHKTSGVAGLDGGLDLVTSPVWPRLLDVVPKHVGSVGVGAVCPPTVKLADSSNPAASWVITKMQGDIMKCGGSMPTGVITAADKKCLVDWITNIATRGKL